MNSKLNKRILVIDDDENIRDSFQDILLSSRKQDPALSKASARLFDDTPVALPIKENIFDFTVDTACNGKEGLEFVQRALAENLPYALIFVDMRMPGWDGLQTVHHIRNIDSRAEIIFVTAYSDHSITDIVREAGSNVGYHCKPFEVEEIRQLATKSVFDWNKTRNLETLISSISSLKTSQWNTDILLSNILHQLANMLGTESAMLLIRDDERFRKVLAIGQLASNEISDPMISTLPQTIASGNHVRDDFAFFQLDPYEVVVLFDKSHEQLRQEHYYLVKLFLEHASQTLINSELHQSLIRQESLSAIGRAVSMISHDMRNVVGVIIGCSELLSSDIGNEESGELIKIIQTSASEGLMMVEDMLDFTRGAAPKISENDSIDFLDKLAGRVEYLEKRFPDISIVVAPSRPFTFKCDTTKMIRVVDNLIQNAAEAIRDNGIEDGLIRIELSARSGLSVLTVEDNGPGIPDSIRNSLFSPFKTHGKESGTGLGLAIVKQFVDSHNGTVDFQSSPGKTIFTITI